VGALARAHTHAHAHSLLPTVTHCYHAFLHLHLGSDGRGPPRQVFVSPLTTWTAAFISGGSPELVPVPSKVVGSCEAVNSAGQWVATLIVLLYQVTNEIKLRRAFLMHEAARHPQHSPRFQAWPLGSMKGLNSVIMAYMVPLVALTVTWHVWLSLMQWVIAAWEGEVPFATLLRLPYAFL
jgi:hypothetical protein